MINKILTLLAISLLFVACEKVPTEETPGNIPGMGNATGELQVDPFSLPEGIEIVGAITGVEETVVAAMPGNEFLKSTNSLNNNYYTYGSGGQWIRLSITMRNTTNYRMTVFFPPGLIFKVGEADTQNGILLNWTWISINPHTTRTIHLDLYCLNKGWAGSSISTNYQIHGITTSELMWKLLRTAGLRMINYEHYYVNTGLKSAEAIDYKEITNQLQDAVWSITNGKGLTDEHIQFIESIPELEPGTYPEGLNDKNAELPLYFEEYSPATE